MYLLVHIPLPPQDNADLHTCLLDEEVSRSTGKEEEGQNNSSQYFINNTVHFLYLRWFLYFKI